MNKGQQPGQEVGGRNIDHRDWGGEHSRDHCSQGGKIDVDSRRVLDIGEFFDESCWNDITILILHPFCGLARQPAAVSLVVPPLNNVKTFAKRLHDMAQLKSVGVTQQ